VISVDKHRQSSRSKLNAASDDPILRNQINHDKSKLNEVNMVKCRAASFISDHWTSTFELWDFGGRRLPHITHFMWQIEGSQATAGDCAGRLLKLRKRERQKINLMTTACLLATGNALIVQKDKLKKKEKNSHLKINFQIFSFF
jgi:hypothetical protein